MFHPQCEKSSETVDLPICETTERGAVESGCVLVANMTHFIRRLWKQEAGQDIAEYAVMLAVILVLVVGTIRLVGSNANNAFSAVASSIQ
jgi:Flp pilus assembly pilin Flp